MQARRWHLWYGAIEHRKGRGIEEWRLLLLWLQLWLQVLALKTGGTVLPF